MCTCSCHPSGLTSITAPQLADGARLGAQLIRSRVSALEALENRLQNVAALLEEMHFNSEDLLQDVWQDMQQSTKVAASSGALHSRSGSYAVSFQSVVNSTCKHLMQQLVNTDAFAYVIVACVSKRLVERHACLQKCWTLLRRLDLYSCAQKHP